jgi:hypothetical protein
LGFDHLVKYSSVFANRVVGIDVNDSEAQLSPAISYGKMVAIQGIKEQTEASRRIKDAADRAIRLDPTTIWPGTCWVDGTGCWPVLIA